MSGDHHNTDDSGPAARVKALEAILTEKGLIDPAAIDAIVDTYETRVGPRNGARVVAKAWTDPAYRKRLLADATKAIAELGLAGPEGGHLVAVENTDRVHNLVVCTLCSCYPWPVLGLPRSGTRASRIGRGRSAIRAACSRILDSSWRARSKFACGIRARRFATSSFRSGPREPSG